MKKLVITFMALFLIAVQLNAQKTTLKVMSINMKESGMMIDYDIEPFCDFIRSENPDFVALQEVQYKTSKISGRDMVTEMASALGMFPLFGRSISYYGGSAGVALLSKYPFFRSSSIIMDVTGQKFPRSCSFVDIKLPNNQIVRLGATHLDHSTDQVRVSMMAKVNNAMLNDHLPSLLIGDFNTSPDSETMQYAKIKWDDLGYGTANTFPYPEATSRIDYVLGYPVNKWKSTMYRVVNENVSFSDHCPLIVELEYE
uniref:endonuclease/exonuclease/phosphatase family protein n=1 Tax=uncultured Draconibacterium sp. TaxID=1573823 RepID=UPI00321808DE